MRHVVLFLKFVALESRSCIERLDLYSTARADMYDGIMINVGLNPNFCSNQSPRLRRQFAAFTYNHRGIPIRTKIVSSNR